MAYKVGDQPVPGFILRQFLGSGGIGEVWRAYGPGGKQCAIKIIRDLQDRGGRKEFDSLQLVKNIEHPNLVSIFGFWLKNRKGQLIPITSASPDESTMAAEAMRAAVEPFDPRQTDVVVPIERTTDPRRTNNAARRTKFESRETDRIAAAEVGPRKRHDREPAELIIAMGLGEKNLLERLEQCRREEPDVANGGIPIDELISYLQGTAEAIDVLNRRGVQHCDVKPQNILVVGRAAQVCDFGLAQAIGRDADSNQQASFSPAYADPVVQKGGNPVDSTDLYCLAATYVELRTGNLPFPANNFEELLAAKERGAYDLSGLKRRERVVVARALSPDPEDRRFESTIEFVSALRDSLAPRRRGLRLPSKRLLWPLLGVALAGGIGWFASSIRTTVLMTHEAEQELLKGNLSAAVAFARRIEDTAERAAIDTRIIAAWVERVEQSDGISERLRTLRNLTSAFPGESASRQTASRVLGEIVETGADLMRRERWRELTTHGDTVLSHELNMQDLECREYWDQMWLQRLYGGMKSKIVMNRKMRTSLTRRITENQLSSGDVGILLAVFGHYVLDPSRIFGGLENDAVEDFHSLRDLSTRRSALSELSRGVYDGLVAAVVREVGSSDYPLDDEMIKTIETIASSTSDHPLTYPMMRVKTLLASHNYEQAELQVEGLPAADRRYVRVILHAVGMRFDAEALRRRLIAIEDRTLLDQACARYLDTESPLLSFTRAIIRHFESPPQPALAARDAMRALSQAETSAAQLSTHHRRRLIAILVHAARNLKQISSDDTKEYVSPHQAKLAVTYLEAARDASRIVELEASMSEIIRVELLAAKRCAGRSTTN